MNQKNAMYFLEIVECKSLTKAAEKLFISQPSLSQMMKKLEDELGFLLFEPGSKPLKLTKTGSQMVDIARSIITFNRAVEDQISSLREAPSRIIRVGVLPGQAKPLLDYIIRNKKVNTSLSEISVMESGSIAIESQLLNDRLDIGIIDGLATQTALHYIPLKEDAFVLVTPRDSAFAQIHASGETLEISELSKLSFFAKPQGCHSRRMLDTISQTYGVSIRIAYELENLENIFPLFPKSNCAMIIPQSFYQRRTLLQQSTSFYYLNFEFVNYHEFLCYRKNLFLSEPVNNVINNIRNLILETGYI